MLLSRDAETALQVLGVSFIRWVAGSMIPTSPSASSLFITYSSTNPAFAPAL